MRIGILGAAPIARAAILEPRRLAPEVEVAAIAARDPARAARFAARHAIPRVHPSYAALLADPELDAVYIPLPNSLHARWSIRALRAGKHVLCEKPLAANADEAAAMSAAAAETGLVLAEGFHYRYHPLALRLKQIVDGGELGQVRHIAAEFSVPLLAPRSIQYRYDLAGGAMMDVGCYAVDLLRFLAGAEPEVTHARARLIRSRVDRRMDVRVHFPDCRTGAITCALLSARLLRMSARVEGTAGSLGVVFPFLPHHFHWITVRTAAGVRRERLDRTPTYTYQLRAFARAVAGGTSLLADAAGGVANMRVIDAVYTAAGLPLRQGAPVAG